MRRSELDIDIAAVAVLCAVMMVIASCGGPYAGKKVATPELKLDLAGRLFEEGKYSDAAVEYKDFLATFAGHERSDFAQFRLAECYRLDEQYPLAAVEYRILVNDYGYSEYIDDALYLEALSAFKQAPRAERDQTKSYEALTRLNRFFELFPTSPRRQEGEELQIELHNRLGKKDFMNARLYFRKKEYAAAIIYLDKVISLYATSSWADRSRYYRGVIYEREGRITEALSEYEAAVASKSSFSEKDDARRRIAALRGEEASGR
ncbi:MAG: outer membrane protein assembly factor BamD [bacterium]|nr:MAG: outer membrane protein assembly factor BamD [bacterium]